VIVLWRCLAALRGAVKRLRLSSRNDGVRRVLTSIGVKSTLQLVAALSLLAVLTLTGASVYFAGRTKTAAHLLLEDGVVGSSLANQLELLLQEHKGLVRSAPAELDRERLATTRKAARELNHEILADIEHGLSAAGMRSASFTELAKQLKSELPAMFNASERVLDFADNFVQDRAQGIAQGPYTFISDHALGQISEWRDEQSRTMNDQVDRLFAYSDILVAWAYGSTGTTLLIGFVGCAIMQGVLRRLRQIQGAVLRLADCDAAAEVAILAEVDEIDAMTRAVQVFRHNTRQIIAQEAELRRANFRFETALTHMSQGLCQYDAHGRLDVFNQRFCEIYRLVHEQIHAGLTFHDVLRLSVETGNHPDQTVEELTAERQSFVDRRESRMILQELGDGRVVAISHRPVLGGGWVETYEDITARRATEAQVVYMARHDGLTGLPNRLVFHERLELALVEAGRGTRSAVLCLDLDHFKAVNDTLGHPVGDGLLHSVSTRLLACVREGDTVARFGGDEFAIIQAGVTRPEDATLLAERIISAIEVPFLIDGHQIVIGVSIGLVHVPDDGSSAAMLLKNADIALYRAKSDGRGAFCFFKPAMDAFLQARRKLELELRKALQEQEFELFYQPVVNLNLDEVSGFEALLRWRHPNRGILSPEDFMSVAEETALIIPLGEWVIRQACADAATWPTELVVSINLSPGQFKSKNLVPAIAHSIRASGLPANRLELEITEAVLLQDNPSTLGILHELRALGARIAIDDFGTGDSFFSFLRNFPVDKIKIDQSFIRDLRTRGEAIHIVRAIQGLSAGLGMMTSAEGVETEEQVTTLRAEGCAEAQGYLFSPPTSASEVVSVVARLRDRRRSGGTPIDRPILTAVN